jgi:hypothetical protein
MTIGLHRPWLPARARRRALNLAMLDRVAKILERRTRWLARSTRRRYEPLILPRVIGLCAVILALGLALPIPLPLSNLVFLIPLIVYAIGLLERDGIWIAIGYAMTLIDLALLVAFASTVMVAIERVGSWLS